MSRGMMFKILCIGVMLLASPITTTILLVFNYLLKKELRETFQAHRRITLVSVNIVLCISAGLISVAYACIPFAIGAAVVYAWVFGGEPSRPPEQEPLRGTAYHRPAYPPEPSPARPPEQEPLRWYERGAVDAQVVSVRDADD